MVLTTPQARRRKANLKAVALEKKSEARNKLLNEQLDEWFDKFDADGDKQFDRDELAALLAHLNPGALRRLRFLGRAPPRWPRYMDCPLRRYQG